MVMIALFSSRDGLASCVKGACVLNFSYTPLFCNSLKYQFGAIGSFHYNYVSLSQTSNHSSFADCICMGIFERFHPRSKLWKCFTYEDKYRTNSTYLSGLRQPSFPTCLQSRNTTLKISWNKIHRDRPFARWGTTRPCLGEDNRFRILPHIPRG